MSIKRNLFLLTLLIQGIISISAQNFDCRIGISVPLNPNGEVLVSAKDYFIDNTNGSILPTAITLQSCFNEPMKKPATDEQITIGCAGLTPVKIWIKYKNLDWQTCYSYLEITNPLNVMPKFGNCPSHYCSFDSIVPYPKITGYVATRQGKPLNKGFIYINYPDSSYRNTIYSGNFSIISPMFNSMKLKAFKDEEPLNGITTFDLVLIQKHILGVQPITDKYALIAADINNNGKVTSADLVELRKMILGIQTKFSNNTSWRFFDKNMNEETAVNNSILKGYNFTAVKIGDINGNAKN